MTLCLLQQFIPLKWTVCTWLHKEMEPIVYTVAVTNPLVRLSLDKSFKQTCFSFKKKKFQSNKFFLKKVSNKHVSNKKTLNFPKEKSLTNILCSSICLIYTLFPHKLGSDIR